MSEAIIAKKAAIVDEVSEKFTAAASVVVVDYRGLTVDEVTRLRKQLRDANVEMKVIKNSILSRAAKKAGLEGLDEVFTGPTAVAFSNEDVVAPAKIMDEFAKEAKALEIKGGIIEGKVSSLEEITALAKIAKPRRTSIYVAICTTSASPQRGLRCQSSGRQRRWRCSLIAA